MSTLEEICTDKPVTLTAYRHDLDLPLTVPVAPLSQISLIGDDASRFLAWAAQPGWRSAFETDLQCIAQDGAGQPLLTTWMPLITFRESFCAGGRQLQDNETRSLMTRLRAEMRAWREAGADTVDVSGYQRQ
ncbi:hypothetical protein E2P84_43840 [Burkholderia cepacia]|uniref:Uncharacterized protein n=1 Tax=Burkholderia cepacia TaxID=292 RepID=A0AAX2RQX8_BURCE|nr:hypothetical protein [Burkholderia cepacia]TES61107.1 hypothetical protein E2P84_43840 [Burkholderia cepacia]TET01634.1 hypothetical protein E3D36_16495 [Burkholderia cepacia]TEU47492.1 hypothetical protein E3D37_15925 [Burkholderia cepacia]TEU53519.1 hypothetical protein E3D38_12315 [Burkholderia cepacia]TEV02125.1 hypothetical protein E3D40_13245 [Burkholderia cepacia]